MIINKTYLLHWKLVMKCKILYSLITIKKLKRKFHNKIPQYIYSQVKNLSVLRYFPIYFI